jgi:hypothetical protein
VAFALLPINISAACLACAAFRSQLSPDCEGIDQPPPGLHPLGDECAHTGLGAAAIAPRHFSGTIFHA